ncbi:MAG TPA: hypothetical protein VFQ82_15975 [Stellaceae bacterium]|nr:hypothetical protein [Stellaceae bacterium]
MLQCVVKKAAWMVLCSAVPAVAQPASDQSAVAASWAADQIKHHRVADFDRRCGWLDPNEDSDGRWSDPCRTLHPEDVVALLLADDVPREGVRIEGARIDGALDLTAAEIKHEVSIVNSRLDGPLRLSRAVLARRMMLDGTRLAGLLDGRELHAQSDLLMRSGTVAKGDVVLIDARIGGNLDLEGSHFEKSVKAERLQLSGSLFMNRHAVFDDDVTLHYATIGGNLELETSAFATGLKAEGVKVSHHMFMVNAVFEQPVSIPYAHISGNLDLSGGVFTRIDLSEATVSQTLILRSSFGAAQWCRFGGRPTLVTLRNAHADTVQESRGSWPERLDLNGFRYERFVGYGSAGASRTSGRSTEEWKKWLHRSSYPGKSYDPQPYMYAAQILAASGDRDKAMALQFDSRQAERAQAWSDGNWGRWAWLSVLRWLCGYGIGIYTFYVVPAVFCTVVVGVLVLFRARAARNKGVFWCVGASLDRLLPIIELNKEFDEFFYDPERQRLRGWQLAFFSAYALWGWILGLLLVAAMSGLTQGT